MASAEQPAERTGVPTQSEMDSMSNTLVLSESNKMDDLSELGEEEEFYGVSGDEVAADIRIRDAL